MVSSKDRVGKEMKKRERDTMIVNSRERWVKHANVVGVEGLYSRAMKVLEYQLSR